jgi:formate dehydrogenase maturation protein FdhE
MSIEDIRDLILKLRPELAETEPIKTPTMFKVCPVCKVEQDILEFHDRSGNQYSYCRTCRNEWQHTRKKLAKQYPKPVHCELCGDEFSDKLRADLDHDHDTQQFRGWLCSHCNRGLGHFRDSPERLQKAITYLKERGKHFKE